MNLLIDSNVILDMVQHREPFFLESKEIIAEGIRQSHSPQGYVRRAKVEAGKYVLPVLYSYSRNGFGFHDCYRKTEYR